MRNVVHRDEHSEAQATTKTGESNIMKKITVGSFCSGTEAPLFALKTMGVAVEHIFSSEINRDALRFMKQNNFPKYLFGDIVHELNLSDVPTVDLFVAGPPCQSFSILNNNRLNLDKKGQVDDRVRCFARCLEYIDRKRPKLAILENVRPLARIWKKSLGQKVRGWNEDSDKFLGAWNEEILPWIEKLRSNFHIAIDIISPTSCDCPHERHRTYIVLSRRDCFASPFVFPAPIPLTKTYHSLLDPAGEVAPDVLPLTGYHKKQIALARERYGEAWRGGVKNLNVLGKQLRLETAVRNHSDVCACLINSNRTIVFDQGTNPEGDRYMSKQEMLRFQGFPSDVKSEGLSNNQLSNLVGNAMNVSVLKALLGNIIRDLTDVVQSGKGGELGAREEGKKKPSKAKKSSLSASPPPSDRRPKRRVTRGAKNRTRSLRLKEVRVFLNTVNGKSKLFALLE
tara:strand:- start:762 stop:2123 length:1362 start_codon:yes stop_codon:yes gene_type:complete